ncbi:tetratricopeptide repeat protein [bacterium]|nr:tetratricopeptide repeat protein [bacterium]
MIRKGINIFLIVSLVVGVSFISTSCGNLKISKLRANHHFSNANSLFEKKKYRDAIEEYEKAMKYNPDLENAHRYLGECYKKLYKPGLDTEENKKKAQKALEALKKAYESNPNDKDIIFSLGDMYDKLREFKKAEEFYVKILEMEPTNMSNYYVVADFYKKYVGMGEDKGEEGKKEKKGKEKSETAEANGTKTPAEKAEEMYLRRIELDPQSEKGYAYITQYYENLDPPKFDEADRFHDKRIKLFPKNAQALVSKAVNRWSKAYRLPNLPKEKRLALAREAEELLLKAEELEPKYPEPYSWLSVVYKSLFAKLEPHKAETYQQRSDMYIEKFKELRKRKAERDKLEEELKKKK